MAAYQSGSTVRGGSASTSAAHRTDFLQRFIIFGSYVTTEPNPRDVDIFLVMWGGFQPRDAPSEA
jgi:hypothetical protein